MKTASDAINTVRCRFLTGIRFSSAERYAAKFAGGFSVLSCPNGTRRRSQTAGSLKPRRRRSSGLPICRSACRPAPRVAFGNSKHLGQELKRNKNNKRFLSCQYLALIRADPLYLRRQKLAASCSRATA